MNRYIGNYFKFMPNGKIVFKMIAYTPHMDTVTLESILGHRHDVPTLSFQRDYVFAIQPRTWCDRSASISKLMELPMCECGKEKHGFASHSTWCALGER